MRVTAGLLLALSITTDAFAAASCKGGTTKNPDGSLVARVLCTHDGIGGDHDCESSWTLRGSSEQKLWVVKGIGVIKGDKDTEKASEERVNTQKILKTDSDFKSTCKKRS